MAAISNSSVVAYIDEEWNATVIPTLLKYIAVPNQSPRTRDRIDRISSLSPAHMYTHTLHTLTNFNIILCVFGGLDIKREREKERERERERKREREKKKERERECVCVCVCKWEPLRKHVHPYIHIYRDMKR